MRISTLFFIGVFTFLPLQAQAQNALSYTTMKNRSTANAANGATPMQTKTVTRDMSPPKDADPEAQEQTDGAPETPVDRVWKKYKALAAGQDTNTENNGIKNLTAKRRKTFQSKSNIEKETETRRNQSHEQIARPKKPIRPKMAKVDKGQRAQPTQTNDNSNTEAPPSATGFAAILQQYQQNKKDRREMRLITVNDGKAPEATEPAAGTEEKTHSESE